MKKIVLSFFLVTFSGLANFVTFIDFVLSSRNFTSFDDFRQVAKDSIEQSSMQECFFLIIIFTISILITVIYLGFLWKGNHDKRLFYLFPAVILAIYFLGLLGTWRDLYWYFYNSIWESRESIFNSSPLNKYKFFAIEHMDFVYYVSFFVCILARIGFIVLIFMGRKENKVKIHNALLGLSLLHLVFGIMLFQMDPIVFNQNAYVTFIRNIFGVSSFKVFSQGSGMHWIVTIGNAYRYEVPFLYLLFWVRDLIGYFIPLSWMVYKLIRNLARQRKIKE